MKTLLILITTIILTIGSTNTYKILEISLLPSRSHHHLNIGIADTLAKAGHEVTIITPFYRKESPCRELTISEAENYIAEHGKSGFDVSKMGTWELMKLTIGLQKNITELMFKSEKISNLFNNETETFDLIIVEYFSGDFLYGLGVKYDCPIILLSPVGMVDTLANLIGNPVSVATVPNMLMAISPGMNLWQRTKNLLFHLLSDLSEIIMLTPDQNELYRKHFPRESQIESLDEAKTRVSLVFSNTHPSIGVSRPLLPKVIEIGGYHITDDPKPLDDELQKIMDSAEDGVIYFSLGSVVRGYDMEDEMKQAIIRSFAKLKQTVLWKFEVDVPEKPNNVFIRKWMPQNAILDHPNLKMFITHGGLLSCTESVHFGVPLIVIPVFGDQPYNAKMVVHRGQGLMMELDNITESSLDWAINEILDNKRYAERARELQDLYYDRPMSPLQAIPYYAEHVIRTKGAKHLSPPKLSKLSLLLIDVYLLLLAILGISIYLVRLCFRKVFQKGVKSVKNSKATKKMKKN